MSSMPWRAWDGSIRTRGGSLVEVASNLHLSCDGQCQSAPTRNASIPLMVADNSGVRSLTPPSAAAARCGGPWREPSSSTSRQCPRTDARSDENGYWGLVPGSRSGSLQVPAGFSFVATAHSHGWCVLAPFAWDAALRLLRAEGISLPEPVPRFGHGVVVPVAAGPTLVGAYHPSQQNTFTGRLTEGMMDEVLAEVRALTAR
jgi:hypothetical protein